MSSIHSQALRLLEGNQSQPHLIPFFPTHDPPPSYPYSFSFHASQGGSYEQDHHLQQQADINFNYGISSDPLIYLVSLPTNMNADLGKQYNTDECDAPKKGSGKWMPSKMRLMKKMMNSDKVIIRKPRRRTHHTPLEQQQSKGDSSSSSTNPNGAVRVCSDCNTTKTPLWRSGPRGPKSLCNACGIRQRKARKAMAEAATNSRRQLPTSMPTEGVEEKGLDGVPANVPYKKRCRFTSAAEARSAIGHDDLTLSLSKSSAFQGVFPQDEKDAAILLMALSCSLKF